MPTDPADAPPLAKRQLTDLKGVMPSESTEMHLQSAHVNGRDLPGASAAAGVTHPAENTSAAPAVERIATSSELEEARATIKRLNRRCQLAEAAVEAKVEDFEKRSQKHLRAYYFAMGKEVAEQEVAGLTTRLAALEQREQEWRGALDIAWKRAEAAEARVAALEQLQPYVKHVKGCWHEWDPPEGSMGTHHPCTCGLRALLAQDRETP